MHSICGRPISAGLGHPDTHQAGWGEAGESGRGPCWALEAAPAEPAYEVCLCPCPADTMPLTMVSRGPEAVLGSGLGEHPRCWQTEQEEEHSWWGEGLVQKPGHQKGRCPF